jgi:tRNA pseudouridine32 synthase / 23S rRNA pseudouridine746 synthase
MPGTGCSGRSDLLILFQNERFVAVDKPPGWLSVPGRTPDEARPVLGRELERELGMRLWPVHRLDAEVTGVIVFAKDAEAHRAASGWFEERAIEKVYEALSEGDGPAADTEQVWRSRLLRGKKRAYESPAGKDCETLARCVGKAETGQGSAWRWRLEPKTGRPHQLRFELARHGHPILGDALYGAKRPWDGGGIALRCVRLGFARCDGAASLGLPVELMTKGLA